MIYGAMKQRYDSSKELMANLKIGDITGMETAELGEYCGILTDLLHQIRS